MISFIVIALWCMMLNGMIFGKIRDIKMPDWLTNPIFDCPVCQMPYYGSIFYWWLFHESVKDWVVVILVAMGIATIFVKIKRN